MFFYTNKIKTTDNQSRKLSGLVIRQKNFKHALNFHFIFHSKSHFLKWCKS